MAEASDLGGCAQKRGPRTHRGHGPAGVDLWRDSGRPADRRRGNCETEILIEHSRIREWLERDRPGALRVPHQVAYHPLCDPLGSPEIRKDDNCIARSLAVRAPAQRRSPVRDAAEEFIRQGAALENFQWSDSKRLRSKIEKTLDAIHDNIYLRPRAADIATLGKGEFLVCLDQEMYRTYVWPPWMSSALHAEPSRAVKNLWTAQGRL